MAYKLVVSSPSYEYRALGRPVQAPPILRLTRYCAHCFVQQTSVRHVCDLAIGDWLWLDPQPYEPINFAMRLDFLHYIQEQG